MIWLSTADTEGDERAKATAMVQVATDIVAGVQAKVAKARTDHVRLVVERQVARIGEDVIIRVTRARVRAKAKARRAKAQARMIDMAL
eukprot:8073634-Pyramimonas_sp.AAC.1